MPNQSNFTPEQIAEILELFFENMAHRQYIGARYVPIFGRKDETSITWDGGADTYEPLTIVLYQGNSYTSRQFVPAGIDITNNEFWAETGNYNAQVEQYRQEVLGYSARIDDVEDDLEQFETDIGVQLGTLSNSLIEMIQSETTNREQADSEIRGDITTINSDIADLDTKIDYKIITVESYGAKGDGVTDCTAAIQQAITDNPNCEISFRGGIYLISNTIFLNGDVGSTGLNLNNSTIKWNGRTSSWQEGQAFTVFPDHDGICSNPIVMFGIERNTDLQETGQCRIFNGHIDCNMKADIAIQNVSFVTDIHNLRIDNFMYAGIFNGTIDGKTYSRGVITSDAPLSTQTLISDCYFVRKGDMSARNTSAIFITFPDNQIDNVVTNRTRYGMTLRCGGNSVSNSHITIQYAQMPTAGNFGGASVRLWPFTSGATQFNVFSNMYFNAGKYVFYTYRDANQSFTGANLRNICSNSHYTFYSTNTFDSVFRPIWYGGMWYGINIINECGFLYSDNCQMFLYATQTRPSSYVARASEMKVANVTTPHQTGYLVDASNYCNGESFIMNGSTAPLPANQYKRVAALVTAQPVADHLMPGAIRFEFSMENGSCSKSGQIVRSGNTYVVNLDAEIGTTGQKMYISTTEHTFTVEGITYYISYLYTLVTANVSDLRIMKITPDSPFVDVYAFPTPINFTDGHNQNIFDTITNLVEVF